jgi:hypothetical protein
MTAPQASLFFSGVGAEATSSEIEVSGVGVKTSPGFSGPDEDEEATLGRVAISRF